MNWNRLNFNMLARREVPANDAAIIHNHRPEANARARFWCRQCAEEALNKILMEEVKPIRSNSIVLSVISRVSEQQ